MLRHVRKAFPALLVIVLMLLLALPTVLAAGAEETEIKGFAYQAQYQSAWNESINHKAWGSWPATDGQYNGAFLWTSGDETSSMTKVTVGGEETYALTFTKPKSLYCIFKPDFARLKAGAAYVKYDFYYDASTPKAFSGINFAYGDSNPIFRVNENGDVYYGSVTEVTETIGQAVGAAAGEDLTGWYTAEMFFIPVGSDGKPLTINPELGSDDFGAITSPERAKIAKNLVYVRLSSYAHPAANSQGITLADLDASAHKLEWTNDKGRDVYSHMQCEIKVTQSNNVGTLMIANAVASLMVPNQTLYKVTYTGHDELTAYATAEHPDVKLANVSGVEAWKITYQDGTNEYLEPGNTLHVTGNVTVDAAVGDDAKKAKLSSAVAKTDLDHLYAFSYAELGTLDANLVSALAGVNGILTDTDPLVVAANEAREAIAERKAFVAAWAEKLINAAEIFGNDEKNFAVRLRAYESVLTGYYDATFSAEVEAALRARNVFAGVAELADEQWTIFNEAFAKLSRADENTDVFAVGRLLLASYEALEEMLPSGVRDPETESLLIGSMTGMKQVFDGIVSLSGKYDYLAQWSILYNRYKAAVYGENTNIEMPAALVSAINAYNALAQKANADVSGSLTVGETVRNTICPAEQIVALLSDIKSRIEE